MEVYIEKIIDIVSDYHNISIEEASNYLNKCLLEVSIHKNLPINEVNKIFYNETFLHNCLIGKCSELDLETCEKACHCVIYGNKCINRRLKYATLINKDPYKFAKSLSLENLEELVKLASYLYFNYDGGGITDNSFDALEYELNKRLKRRGRRYEKIGAEPVEKLRVELPFPMPSLRKIKPDTRECDLYLENTPDDNGIVWSLKLDGVSGMVSYYNGEIDGIYTRGNGEIGGLVTYLKDYIKFPKVDQNIIVRGEFILSKKKWEEKYKGVYYNNPRGLVSAQINQGFISPILNDIEFVAYDILKIENQELPTVVTRLKMLELYDFNVVEFGEWKKTPLTFDIISLYVQKRHTSIYHIDGVVLAYNIDTNPADLISYAKNTVAFKMLLEEQLRETTVINVSWEISRYGKYIPVAVYEAVFIEGIRLTRSSAHNAAHIQDWNMGAGTQIKVARGGDVIPQIKDVIINPAVEPIYPDDTYAWGWQGKHIKLLDIENNKIVQIKRIHHFFNIIGVPKLGEKTSEKLWEKGLISPEMIIHADIPTLMSVRGIGKISAENIYNNIQKRLAVTPVDRYLKASSILELGIGRKLVKTLLRTFPEILEEEKTSDEIKRLLKTKKIPGIGPKRIENISTNIPVFRNFLMSLNKDAILKSIARHKKIREDLQRLGYNDKIKGKIFVFTGFMEKVDYDLEDYIYDNLGDFSSTVTSNVTAVVAASLGTITQKMEDAIRLNIPVYNIKEFMNRFNINYL